MAQDSTNSVSFYIALNSTQKDDLGALRHFYNLKIAFDTNMIWVKDFDFAQINSLEVKSIPYKKVYYAQSGKLFLKDSLLPDCNIPALLWTPIERGLPVKLPPFNHNYFGIKEKLTVNIIPCEQEIQATAMIIPMPMLKSYIESAPWVRLKRIKWVIIKPNIALLFGTPILPLQSDVYWQRSDFLIPVGYDIDLPLLSNSINDLLNPTGDSLVVWNKDSSYFLVEKSSLRVLSIGSFRLSTEQEVSEHES